MTLEVADECNQKEIDVIGLGCSKESFTVSFILDQYQEQPHLIDSMEIERVKLNAFFLEKNTMDRSGTLTVQTNQDHKTEKSNAISPTIQRQSSVKPSPDAADSNKKVIELQAEIETLDKSTAEQRQLLAELKNRLRASRAENLSPREQLQKEKDLAEVEENITVIQNQIMDLRRGLDDFNRG
ncbi:hypothetical protein DAPPUDRAFT_109584 [Daphnia pulex]|uniref:Uncharacterized protein n=1 Tax=Daphnia pulex TaxID=6669 RepID=E9H3I8_DAPPU|nr:hypothetical protein DAPPUDRAFT_109584 [Daphnia pulex]|eukprot:EFX73521.1 hypothetical protein DAPPUDRAFT_109584 [Daphnia pulex]